MILIDAEDLAARRPDRPLFEHLSITVSTGDRVGVVGLNGCGKSTLLRMLAGDLAPEDGQVRWGRGVRIGFLAQHPELGTGTVREVVGRDADVDAWQVAAVLDRLGMADVVDASVDSVSGGQAKRVALARLLVHEHDVLVLDEPTNHLDLDAVSFLEDELSRFGGGLVVVTHDRHLLDRITTRVLELDRGRGYLYVPQGWHEGSGYAAYLEGRAERAQREATAEAVRQNLARRELAWLRRGAPARTAKPKARMEAARALVAGGPPPPARRGDLDAAFGSRRLGSKAIELHGVGFAWPDGTRVLHPFDHRFEPGDRVGLVGPNGAGKSTLLDLVAGRLAPTEGTIDRGRTVVIGYYDQLGRSLDPAQRVRDVIAGDRGAPSPDDVRLMERFWFDGDAQFAPIGTLSGGERRRLQLLLTLVAQPNVLLLDEPTNDLDLDTLRALEDLLESWPGVLVVVSHDRTFLDRTVDEVVALDGAGSVARVRGGVEGWLRARSSRPVTPSPAPATARDDAGRRRPDRAGRSPSTLRRLLGQSERAMADAQAACDRLLADLAAATDHRERTRIGDDLARAHEQLHAAEAEWLELASELESQGLEP